MRLLYCLIFFFVASSIFAQVPGKALKLAGSGKHVAFGEVLKDVRTISFWIQLDSAIDSTNLSELPILVRDNNDPQTFGTGEFAIYFGKAGSSEAGRLVFLRASTTTAYKITSDAHTWFPNRWYHIAAVLHPTDGMKLYVNGVLQQDTNSSTQPIYIRNEGTTGTVYLGKWGNIAGYGIHAKFDELRFYASALSETYIRSKMCEVEVMPNSDLKGYYNFDNSTTSFIPSLSGQITGLVTGVTVQGIIPSNAPVGDESEYLYNFQSNSVLSISEIAVFTIDSLESAATGVHLYKTHSNLLAMPGSIPYFFGVWFSDTMASYNTNIDFQPMGLSCDSCAELMSRDFQIINQWKPRNEVPDNCQYSLVGESPGNVSWREEYWLKPKLHIGSGLPDTLTECKGVDLIMFARDYPGARYLWDDGSTLRTRRADSTGMYVVNIKWHGCESTDTVWVKRSYTPYFKLPNDTAICAGDTLLIEAPLDIDSAFYSWGNGIHFGRKFRMWYAGTISLKITVGNCSWEDEISVDLIKNFQLNLGKDSTLCLGQEYKLQAPPNVNFQWSTGETSREITVFNQPQKIWLKAWNECFEKVDTIALDYQECDCHFYVANTFTPNNDGKNDLFLPVSSCYFQEYDFELYNRWGILVFKSASMNEGWDGTINGQNAPEGVYTYQLRYKKYSWMDIGDYQRGTIQLIR